MTGQSQYFHATAPWDHYESNHSWFRGMSADDPRIVWCTRYCTLPPDACEKHEACPFHWERKGQVGYIPASVALERCKRLVEEAEHARRRDG